MCTMSEMETEGTPGSFIWLITKCLHDPKNLQLPGKLCRDRGFTCGEDDKVFGQARVERTQKKEFTIRMTIPSSLSEPDIRIIERSDLSYVHFFGNREAETFTLLSSPYVHFYCQSSQRYRYRSHSDTRCSQSMQRGEVLLKTQSTASHTGTLSIQVSMKPLQRKISATLHSAIISWLTMLF